MRRRAPNAEVGLLIVAAAAAAVAIPGLVIGGDDGSVSSPTIALGHTNPDVRARPLPPPIVRSAAPKQRPIFGNVQPTHFEPEAPASAAPAHEAALPVTPKVTLVPKHSPRPRAARPHAPAAPKPK